MISSIASVPLSTYLDDACAASDRLVAALRAPVTDLGLSREEHLVLLTLWNTDGVPQSRIADVLRLPLELVERAVSSLRQRVLVEPTQGGDTVWLTEAGWQMQERVGRDAMRRRLHVLEADMAALSEALQRALDAAVATRFGATKGQA